MSYPTRREVLVYKIADTQHVIQYRFMPEHVVSPRLVCSAKRLQNAPDDSLQGPEGVYITNDRFGIFAGGK